MPDYGAMYADRQIASITKELKATYRTAQRELKEKLADFNKKFEKKNAEKRKRLESGEITAQQYRDWLTGQVFMRNQWESNIRQVNTVLHDINNQSLNLINSKRLDVFAENYNFNAFRAERETGISFGLYNAQAVAQLVLDDPQLLPEWKIDEEKDYTWNYKKVNNIVKQGIIQGEGVQQITDRLCRDLCTMNENKMKMFARTALTEAQSAGRQQQMQDAHDMGIEVKKQWLATLDGRTRDSHRYLDGKEVPFDKPFKSEFGDIMFPGDPTADAADVFNCRCTIVTIYPKYDTGREDWRQNEIIEGQEYRKWKEGKAKNSKTISASGVEGKDITETWKRRADKFDFEIEDVINAQGFDGAPRIVSQEEFDKAVKESGFVAQRTYSAPDQETLDAYRDQLYNGKWYIDCSTGGAQYGQGMYCAADYDGIITDGMKEEMQHYIQLQDERLGYANGALVDKARREYAVSQRESVIDSITDEKEKAVLRYEFMGNPTKEDKTIVRRMTQEEYDAVWEKAKKASTLAEQRYMDAMNMPRDEIAKMFNISDHAPHYIETLTLTPNAKIISYNDIMKQYEEEYLPKHSYENTKAQARNDVLDEMGLVGRDKLDYITMLNLYSTGTTKAQIEKLHKLEEKHGTDISEVYEKMNKRIDYLRKDNIDNIGSYAASLGYDAINAEGHGKSGSYTVVLNRTKCIILGGTQ